MGAPPAHHRTCQQRSRTQLLRQFFTSLHSRLACTPMHMPICCFCYTVSSEGRLRAKEVSESGAKRLSFPGRSRQPGRLQAEGGTTGSPQIKRR
jgi:hypothetical protein